jgi:hypothetical protein
MRMSSTGLPFQVRPSSHARVSAPTIVHQSPISLGRFNEFGVSLSLLALLADFDRKEPEKVFQARGEL